MNIFDIEIINWKKLNTFKFWPGLFFTICHPIYAWRYDRNCMDSFLWRCMKFFTETIKGYIPFSNACRWLAAELLYHLANTKYIDRFCCREYGDYTTYYKAWAMFGYYSVYQLYYAKTGKTYAEKPIKTKVVSGWVWRKKTAMKLLKQIIMMNYAIYKSKYQSRPEIANPWVMHIVDDMQSVLYTGKFVTEACIDSQIYEDRFKSTHDNIEKLWCYVAYLLSCPNDFYNHEQIARIFRACDEYLFYKEMKTRPEIDFTYRRILKNQSKTAAKKWQVQEVKEHNKTEMTRRIQEEIDQLREFYLNQPYEYYRV